MLELGALDRVLPFAILLLPLAGFVVLALFGDWIKKDKEDAGAGYLACATVITSFGLAAWTTVRLYGLVGGAGRPALLPALPRLRVDRGGRLPGPAQPARGPALVR